MNTKSSLTLGIFIALGLFSLGYVLGGSILKYKSMERTVSVKGLAQKEVNADIVIWPLQYIRASNRLSSLYDDLESDTNAIVKFLKSEGFSDEEISITAPHITDKLAQSYGGGVKPEFRYMAFETITLYTSKIDKARKSMVNISKLGKSGIVFKSDSYQNKIEYKFLGLNAIKPQMIEEATKNARASAQKFAQDSQSKLGKIKSARQGQFSISARDTNTPYVKRVRVVSTVEYYLRD